MQSFSMHQGHGATGGKHLTCHLQVDDTNLSSSAIHNINLNTIINEQRKQIKKLEKQLNNTKIFLNMVIHDMRNPTNSIEFAMKEILKMIEAGHKAQIEKNTAQTKMHHFIN